MAGFKEAPPLVKFPGRGGMKLLDPHRDVLAVGRCCCASARRSADPVTSELNELFGLAGPLARSLPGYAPRPEQLEMAEHVATALDERETLIVEAGPGTGKTLAYLVPALLAGGKVIISTGTKTLQDQLYKRDIPTVRAALKIPVTVALLKGRANYICHYHLERSLQDTHLSFINRDEIQYLQQIERYANNSKNGDKSELSEIPENAAIWR